MRFIRSLAPLVSKVKEPQVETMVDTLCSNMTSDKEPLRDISSMGLKAVIAELPLSSSGDIIIAGIYIFTWICKRAENGRRFPVTLVSFSLRLRCRFNFPFGVFDAAAGSSLTVGVCKKITSQLMAALENQEDVSVQLEALDILSDMLGRYRPYS